MHPEAYKEVMKMDQTQLIQEFIRAAIAQGDAIDIGDSKTANKEYSNLSRIYKKLAKDRLLAESVLNELFQNSNHLVRGRAAARALGLKINVNQAIKILDEISKMTDIGIHSFNAEMTIKVWMKDGELRFK